MNRVRRATREGAGNERKDVLHLASDEPVYGNWLLEGNT